MGLWCGHAVLPFSSFDLVFLFHLLGQVVLALVTFFALSLLSLLFLFLFSSLSPGSVWSWCVCAFSEASFLCFCSDLLFLFSSGFPASTGFRRASQVLSFILFYKVFLSAFEISFSSRPFLFGGGGGGGGGLAWAFCLRSCVGFCGLFSWFWEDSCFCLCLGR